MRIAVAVVVAVLLGGVPVAAESPADWMVKLTLDGRRIEGTPLAWSSQQVHLLGRDGRLWEFSPRQAGGYQKTSSRFRAYSTSELRAILLRELSKDYEVSGTGHYLVAHPRGQRDQWARRFEDLYRSFVHYFSVRGFKLDKPPFPLLGVVCKSQGEFLRYSAGQGSPAGAGVLGSYALDSNRILLFDAGAGASDSADWQQNASVAIHEATHQTAFNTGIHNRYAPPPVWVVEGLATMFEAPGVYNSRYHTRRTDRVNRGRLVQFKQSVVAGHRPELLAGLIGSDHLFRTNPATAYAEAWALTFYLMETQRGKYADYLARTAQRPPFQQYTATERTADFTAVFGDDWRMLEARFLRFMEGVE